MLEGSTYEAVSGVEIAGLTLTIMVAGDILDIVLGRRSDIRIGQAVVVAALALVVFNVGRYGEIIP